MIVCYRKYRWTLSWWIMTGSERQILLATLNLAATLQGRSYAIGATCWPIHADQLPSGTRYRKYPRRTNWATSTAHVPIRFRQTGSSHVSRSVKVFPVRLQQGSTRFDLVTSNFSFSSALRMNSMSFKTTLYFPPIVRFNKHS